MTRRESRISAFKLVFQQGCNPKQTDELFAESDPADTELDDFSTELVLSTIRNMETIDESIRPHLKRWTLSRLPRVSLAILRVSCAQLFYMKEEVPVSVVINEAVELAKLFGAEDEYAFVNGTLRSICSAQATE